LAKKVRSFLTVDADRACSDRGSEKDECSNGTPYSENRVSTTQLLYHGGGQRKELL